MPRLLTALLLLAALPVCALAQAPSPAVSQARSLLEAGRAVEALELLEPLEPKLAGDLEYDYLLGIAALNANQPSKATFIFERVIALAPGFAAVRADMGKAYYLLGDYARAKIEFETVLTFQNLPPDLKGIAEKYMAALSGSALGGGAALAMYVEAGMGRDSNANNATHINPIRLAGGVFSVLPADSLARRDSYKALNAGIDYNTPLESGLSLYAGGDYRGRYHNSMDTSDYALLDGRVGVGYSSGSYLLRGGLVGGYYSTDNQLARTNLGLTLDWRYALDASNQLTASTSAIQYRFTQTGADKNDYLAYSGSLGWFGALDAQSGLSASLLFGREKANGIDGGRDDGDKNSWGLRFSYQTTIAGDIGAFISAGAQWGEYSRINTTYGERRRDDTYDLAVGGSISLGDRWTLRPLVSRIVNRSSHDITDYRKTDYSLSLRKDF